MKNWSKLRRWINRDDGRFYQIGDVSIGIWTTVGILALVGALILWWLHIHIGVNGAWAVVTGLAGLVFLFLGASRDASGNDT
jgi:hypothetical protein